MDPRGVFNGSCNDHKSCFELSHAKAHCKRGLPKLHSPNFRCCCACSAYAILSRSVARPSRITYGDPLEDLEHNVRSLQHATGP